MKIQKQLEHDGYQVKLEVLQEEKELTINICVENLENDEMKEGLWIDYLFYVSTNFKNYYEKINEKITENSFKKRERKMKEREEEKEEYNEYTQQYREKVYFDEHSNLPHLHTKKYVLKKELIEEVLIHLFTNIQTGKTEEKKHFTIAIGDDGDKKEYVIIIESEKALQKLQDSNEIIMEISNEYTYKSEKLREVSMKINDETAKRLKEIEGVKRTFIPQQHFLH